MQRCHNAMLHSISNVLQSLMLSHAAKRPAFSPLSTAHAAACPSPIHQLPTCLQQHYLPSTCRCSPCPAAACPPASAAAGFSSLLITLAGLPPTTVYSSTSAVTTAPAAMVEPRPTVTPGMAQERGRELVRGQAVVSLRRGWNPEGARLEGSLGCAGSKRIR